MTPSGHRRHAHLYRRARRRLPLASFSRGPGLDHHMFGDYLDTLADEYRQILVDQRSNGRSDRTPEETWTLRQMAADVGSLARELGLEQYAVLGHSYGAFVVLQHAVNFPGDAAHTIVSSGIPSARFLEQIARNLAAFEPVELREQAARPVALPVRRSARPEDRGLRAAHCGGDLLHGRAATLRF